MQIFDLSRQLTNGTPVYPGDPPVVLTTHADYADHGYRVTRLELGTHAGTHLDAPAHFLPSGASLDAVGLAALVGPARVIEAGAPPPEIQRGERLLVRSGWGAAWGTGAYFESFPGLDAGLAETAAGAPAALVGVETPSLHPDAEEDARLHRLLLGAGVLLLENLAGLERLPERVFLAALPLPLAGVDGAPCRVIAMTGLEV